MNDKNRENIRKEEYNTPIPTTNFNGTPNLNTLSSQNQSDNKNKVRERRMPQTNIWGHLSKDGYIGLQILIIIITLATILGMIIGATIYVYTK